MIKKSRKSLSIVEKINLIEEIDKGVNRKDIAACYCIPTSTLGTIYKNRENLLKQNECDYLGRKRIKMCLYEEIDEAVLKWVKMVRNKNFPLSGDLIKRKALEYALLLNKPNFQASTGWLDKFKKRHGISQKTMSGESADIIVEDCEAWKITNLPKILKRYESKDVFNADETGLFYKCLPSKTLTFRNEKCFGGKHRKERITVMLAANMTGTENMKLLVIGKSKTPRCFKGVKSLEVDYDFNKKSWMTGDIFQKWLLKIDKKMISQNRKIVMFVDNCPAHPRDLIKKLKNIELVYFPPNMTAKLQPLDQGVIKNFKLHYRKRILLKAIKAFEDNTPINGLFNLRDCISEISKAWTQDVSSSTIENCFRKAGFNDEIDNDQISEDDLCLYNLHQKWKLIKDIENIPEEITLDNYIQIDEEIATVEYPTDQDIVDIIISKKSGNNNEVDSESDETDETETFIPQEKDVTRAFAVIRHRLQFFETTTDEIFSCLNKCETFFENQISFKNTKQTEITDYFK